MLLNVRLDVDVRNLSVVMEEMKLVDVHHTQLMKNFTIVKGTVDDDMHNVKIRTVHVHIGFYITSLTLLLQVLLDHLGPKETVVRPAQEGLWDSLGAKVTKEL